MQIESAIEYFCNARAHVVSPKTMRLYHSSLHVLLPLFAGCPVEAITTDDLRKWRQGEFERNAKLPENTHAAPRLISVHHIHGEIRVVKTFFKFLYEEKRIPENPAARLELPPLPDHEPKAISDADAQRMLEAAKYSPRDYAILLFVGVTGCRLGGLLRLKLEDLDFELRRATVHEKGRAGRYKARTVFMTKECADALAAWLDVRAKFQPTHEYVFTTISSPRAVAGQPLTESTAAAMFDRIARAADVKGKFNPHAWRHAFARRMTRNGMPLGTLSKIMGHSDVGVTVGYYARFAVGELQEAYDKYANGASR